MQNDQSIAAGTHRYDRIWQQKPGIGGQRQSTLTANQTTSSRSKRFDVDTASPPIKIRRNVLNLPEAHHGNAGLDTPYRAPGYCPLRPDVSHDREDVALSGHTQPAVVNLDTKERTISCRCWLDLAASQTL